MNRSLCQLAGLSLQALTAVVVTLGAAMMMGMPFWVFRKMWPRTPFDAVCVGFFLFLVGLSVTYVAWRLWRTLGSPTDTRLFPPGLYQFLLYSCIPKGHIVVPIDSPVDRMAELLLWDAAVRRADKLVFGEPTDDLPRTQPPPPSTAHLTAEELELLRRVDEMPIEPLPELPWQTQCDLPVGKLPVWLRLGQQWEEQLPLPLHLFPHLIQSLEKIMGRSFDTNESDRTLVFRQMTPLKTRLRASMRMEKNYCYSVTLQYLDEM